MFSPTFRDFFHCSMLISARNYSTSSVPIQWIWWKKKIFELNTNYWWDAIFSDAAMNESYLLKNRITHVLNAAGNINGPAPVKTGQNFYKVRQLMFLINCIEFFIATRFLLKGSKFSALILWNFFLNSWVPLGQRVVLSWRRHWSMSRKVTEPGLLGIGTNIRFCLLGLEVL